MIDFHNKEKYKLIAETDWLKEFSTTYFMSAYLEINTEIVWLIRSHEDYVGFPLFANACMSSEDFERRVSRGGWNLVS